MVQHRGLLALAIVSSGVMGTVFWVHRSQTRERQTMREAVLRDIIKLEKRGH